MADNVDWSGHAARISSKKHLPAAPSKIANLSVGIGPIEETAWNPGRRVTDGEKSSSTASLLGGPVPESDPSSVGSSHWQTEARAASSQTKTTRDQLTESGRSMFVRGKATTTPAYELARPFDETVGARLREENPYSLNENRNSHCADKAKTNEENGHPNKTDSADDSSHSLVGYRSGGGARSFLEGLGADVAASPMFNSTTDE